jgi:hypothetical protein
MGTCTHNLSTIPPPPSPKNLNDLSQTRKNPPPHLTQKTKNQKIIIIIIIIIMEHGKTCLLSLHT